MKPNCLFLKVRRSIKGRYRPQSRTAGQLAVPLAASLWRPCARLRVLWAYSISRHLDISRCQGMVAPVLENQPRNDLSQFQASNQAGEWRTMSMVGEEEPRTPYLRTGLRQVVLGSDWGTGDTLILCACHYSNCRPGAII